MPESHLQHLEQRKLSYRRLHDSGQAAKLLRQEVPSLLLLNPNLPDSDPHEVFKLLQRCVPEMPVILLLPADQVALGGEMMASGAADYFVHGTYDRWKLEKRIRREIQAAATENDYRNEAALLAALLGSIPDRIYFKDRESRFLRVSRAHAEFFGAGTPDQMIGLTDADYFDATHAKAARSDELAVMQSGEPLINRLELESFPDGRMGWALSTKVPFRTPEGRIIGTLGISRDVTELHETQRALSEERTLLRSLIDALPDSIYIKDSESRFLLANLSCARLMGAGDPEALVGKCDHDYYPADYADRFRADERRLVETGQTLLAREEQVLQADGTVVWMLTSKIPIRDSDGRIAGFVGIGRDMTRFRKLEEEVETLRGGAVAG